jgi:hypothetical protein
MKEVSTRPAKTTLAHRFYRKVLERWNEAGVPYLVGGAFAFREQTGIQRITKDFDVFIRRRDLDRAFEVCEGAGFEPQLTFPHWLAKVRSGRSFIDLVFGSANGLNQVDDEWFEHATDGEVLGVRVRLCPSEETILSKSFVMERERFDGADIAHILLDHGRVLDWPRLLARFGPHWRVLLAHLTLFGFIYPSERDRIPPWVMDDLTERLRLEARDHEPGERVCRGTLLSYRQYLIDVERGGFADARLAPYGSLSPDEVAAWTEADKT